MCVVGSALLKKRLMGSDLLHPKCGAERFARYVKFFLLTNPDNSFSNKSSSLESLRRNKVILNSHA